MRPPAFIAMGANLPTETDAPLVTLLKAVELLADAGIAVVARSLFYQTPAFPAGSGPDYVNAALSVRTDMQPFQLLETLHRIEGFLGRMRKERWAARAIDLDLLAMGDMVLPDHATQARWSGLPQARQLKDVPPELILPHPRMHERAFVLVPLGDVAPNWVHPVLGLSVAEMLARLGAEACAEIRPIDGQKNLYPERG